MFQLIQSCVLFHFLIICCFNHIFFFVSLRFFLFFCFRGRGGGQLFDICGVDGGAGAVWAAVGGQGGGVPGRRACACAVRGRWVRARVRVRVQCTRGREVLGPKRACAVQEGWAGPC